jgi:uncharacterized membrane protein YdbT with pleckstrin-like domain
MNVFPSTIAADVGSSTTNFIASSGLWAPVIMIAGILLAFWIIEIFIGIFNSKKETTTTT